MVTHWKWLAWMQTFEAIQFFLQSKRTNRIWNGKGWGTPGTLPIASAQNWLSGSTTWVMRPSHLEQKRPRSVKVDGVGFFSSVAVCKHKAKRAVLFVFLRSHYTVTNLFPHLKTTARWHKAWQLTTSKTRRLNPANCLSVAFFFFKPALYVCHIKAVYGVSTWRVWEQNALVSLHLFFLTVCRKLFWLSSLTLSPRWLPPHLKIYLQSKTVHAAALFFLPPLVRIKGRAYKRYKMPLVLLNESMAPAVRARQRWTTGVESLLPW